MTAQKIDLANRISLRPKEMAAVSGLGYSTIKKHLADGDLPFVRDGRAVLILVADAKAFIKNLAPST